MTINNSEEVRPALTISFQISSSKTKFPYLQAARLFQNLSPKGLPFITNFNKDLTYFLINLLKKDIIRAIMVKLEKFS